MPGKRIQLDDATWHALAQLAKDRMQDFQELAGRCAATNGRAVSRASPQTGRRRN
jgi:hypothetical protein